MVTALRRFVRALGALLVFVLALLISTGPARAQAPPAIDHYLVYRVDPPLTLGAPVALRDQFRPTFTPHTVFDMPFFANPVVKDSFPLFDPRLHYTWWHISPDPFHARVLVTNQFGDQQLDVRDSRFLLNPALKFPQPGQPLPFANHYKCYDANGPAPGRLVTLEDQFGFRRAYVDSAVFFCNPAEKQYQGQIDLIVRADAHLVCYRIRREPPAPVHFPITFLDQFLFGQTNLVEEVFLCVPTLKQDVVPAKPQTWGGLKAIYR